MKVVRAMLVAFAALLMAAPTVAQTGYPDRPVRIIVGFTAGSATDITARMFAQKLNAAWNVPVTVENIPGAGGSVGGDRVAKAAPDGTTLYWGANGAMTINPSLLPNPTFDPVRDLAPIARVLVMPSLLVVNNDVPAPASRNCSHSPRPGPDNCHMRRPASARRSTLPASYSRVWRALTSSTSPIAAWRWPM
jgi:tripartite-type tricarboxylate transporter receptor subunit TctC